MGPKPRTWLLPVLLPLAFAACSERDDATVVPEASADDHAIHWFAGGVDAAFSRARAERRPVYLYWGAIWCPPCQEIKNTVFRSDEFIALSKLFIPVYLDGDTERAQAAGERFGVRGYPTMIVFDPQGEEVTRIPGGIDIASYNAVLELSLAHMTPMRDLVERALADPAGLGATDYVQLAYYSWGQDDAALPANTPATLFRDLAERARTFDAVAAARLYLQYLMVATRAGDSGTGPGVEGAAHPLRDILDSDRLTLACWDTLAYHAEILDALAIDEATRAELAALWQRQVLKARSDPGLSTAERLAAWLPYLYFHFQQEGDNPVPPDVQRELLSDLQRADRATTDPHARQSVVSQIAYVYEQARMDDAAHALLIAELDTSVAPWYFMSDLGSLAEKAGNNAEALDWYRRAYDASAGPATRLQWGAGYVRALIRLTPDDRASILDSARALLPRDGAEPGIFSGRNFRVLRTLQRELADWQAVGDRTAAAQPFISQLRMLCERQPAGTRERDNCTSLLGTVAES